MSVHPWALLVTRNFPPLVGGMERVNLQLMRALRAEWQVAVAGPAGARGFVPDDVVVRSSPIRPLGYFLAITMLKAVAFCLRKRPKLVLAGSGLSAPTAWMAGRLCGARVAVYLHGLDIIAPSRVYQVAWLPFIRSCDIVLVNSENTAQLAIGRGVDAGRVAVLHPGTNIPVLDDSACRAFREKFGLGNGAVLLSVGRLTLRKGLAEFVSKALPDIVVQRPDTRLVIIGGEASDALHGTTTSQQQRIQADAQAAGVADHVKFLGNCDEITLSQAYQAADCHVFPILDLPGDVEGFGMVALESAAHGLSTVAFDVGGVADAVDPHRTGTLVPAGDYGTFAQAVLQTLDAARSTEATAARREFAHEKSWDRFDERLRRLVSGHG